MALRTISKSIDLNSSSNKYITDINDNGIQIHSPNYNASQYTENITMNPQGIQLNYGNLPAMELTKNSLVFNEVDTANNTSTRTATFGENTQIGRKGKYRTTINEKGIKLLTDTNIPSLSVGPGDKETDIITLLDFTDTNHTFVASSTIDGGTTYNISSNISSLRNGDTFSISLYRKWKAKQPNDYNLSTLAYARGSNKFEFTKGTSETKEYVSYFTNYGATMTEVAVYDGSTHNLTIWFPEDLVVDDNSYIMDYWYLYDLTGIVTTTVPKLDIHSEMSAYLETDEGYTTSINLDQNGFSVKAIDDSEALSVSSSGIDGVAWKKVSSITNVENYLIRNNTASNVVAGPYSTIVSGSKYEVKINIRVMRIQYNSSSRRYITTEVSDGTYRPRTYIWNFTKGVTDSTGSTKNLYGCSLSGLTYNTLNVKYDGVNDKFTFTRTGNLFNSLRKHSTSNTTYYAVISCSISGHASTKIPSVSTRGVLDIGYNMRFDDPRDIFIVDDDWTWSPNMTHGKGNESNTTFHVYKAPLNGIGYWPLFIVDFNRRNGAGGSGVSNWCCGAMFLKSRNVGDAEVYIKGNAAGGDIKNVNAGVKILWLKLTHEDVYSSQSDVGPDD